MGRLEPRPPAKPRSPLSPATLEVMRRLGGGRGGLLILTGQDPVARRELLRAIQERAEESQIETIRVRVHPLDAVAPFSALLPWFARWYDPALEGAHPPKTQLDASFFTALAGLLSVLPEGGRGGRGEGPEGISEVTTEKGTTAPLGPEEVRTELLSLVERRTREGPALVTIEAAEFLDGASRDWLAFMAPRLPELPVVIVASLDPGSASADRWRRDFAQVSTTWERWPPEGSARHREPPLSERLRGLSPSAREALGAVVAAGPEAREPFLEEALGWPQERIATALEEVHRAGWVEPEGEGWALLDARLHPDLAGTLDPALRRRLHGAIGASILRRGRNPQGALLFRLGEHLAEAGEALEAAEKLEQAASEADRWGSPELAEAALQRALSLLKARKDPEAERMEERLYGHLASTRILSSNPTGAAEAYNHALALSRDRGRAPVEWARYVAGLARAEIYLGGDPEELLRKTLAQVEGRSKEIESILLSSLALLYRERGRGAEATDTAERASLLADQTDDIALKVNAHDGAASAYFFGGAMGDLRRAREHLERALSYRDSLEGTPDAHLNAVVLDALSHVELALGRPEEAARQGEAALRVARTVGTRSCLLLIMSNQAELQIELGDLSRARELAQAVRQLCDRYSLGDMDADRQQLLLVEGRLAGARGAFEPARQRLLQLAAASEKAGTRYFLGQALVHLAALYADRGDLAGARTYVDRLDQDGLRASVPGITRPRLERVEARLRSAPLLSAHRDDRTAP